MHPSTRILIAQIGEVGYGVAWGRDEVEAVDQETGERSVVHGDDIDEMVDELARLIVEVGL